MSVAFVVVFVNVGCDPFLMMLIIMVIAMTIVIAGRRSMDIE